MEHDQRGLDGGQENLKVFISYSRDDGVFAKELLSGLEFDGGYEVFIDEHDIHEGEVWQERLHALIVSADTVVFVMSPSSVASEICRWEIKEAVANSKRIVPVLATVVQNANVPEELSKLNYVRFDGSRSFMTGLFALRRALNIDVDWLREHTRLLERAREWHEAGRLANRMLSGPDIADAKSWLDARPADAPAPTDLHREYILACELAETDRVAVEKKRLAEMEEAQAARSEALGDREVALGKLSRRTTVGLVASGGLTTLAAGLAYWGYDAEARFRREQELAAEEARRRGADRTDIVGQVVAYAASPGQLAMDGEPGGNSPYTETVLGALANPNTSFQSALNRASTFVLDKTAGRQRPFYSTDMNGDLYPLRQPGTRKRKALCVSVGQMGEVEFPNVKRDADDWAAFLRNCQFDVQLLHDPVRKDLVSAFDTLSFREKPENGETDDDAPQRGLARIESPPENTLAVFFLAGIGLQVSGVNYLATIDTEYESAEDATRGAVSFGYIAEAMRSAAAASVIVLDTGFLDPYQSSVR